MFKADVAPAGSESVLQEHDTNNPTASVNQLSAVTTETGWSGREVSS